MKVRLRNVLAVLLIIIWACAVSAAVPNSVYITAQGKKYHRAQCRNVHTRMTKITRAVAKKRGYTACKVCKP